MDMGYRWNLVFLLLLSPRACTGPHFKQQQPVRIVALHCLPHKDAARETSYGYAFGASLRVRAFRLRTPFRAPPSLNALPDLTVSSTIPLRLSKLPHAVHYQFKMRAPCACAALASRVAPRPTANRSLSPTSIIGRCSIRTLRRTPYIQPCPQLTEPAFPIPTSPSLPRHAPRPPTTPPINAHIPDSPQRRRAACPPCSAPAAHVSRPSRRRSLYPTHRDRFERRTAFTACRARSTASPPPPYTPAAVVSIPHVAA
ncbi:hypothetical protein B0H13DRAFT_2100196, partial [Mycena leptocephala]